MRYAGCFVLGIKEEMDDPETDGSDVLLAAALSKEWWDQAADTSII